MSGFKVLFTSILIFFFNFSLASYIEVSKEKTRYYFEDGKWIDSFIICFINGEVGETLCHIDCNFKNNCCVKCFDQRFLAVAFEEDIATEIIMPDAIMKRLMVGVQKGLVNVFYYADDVISRMPYVLKVGTSSCVVPSCYETVMFLLYGVKDFSHMDVKFLSLNKKKIPAGALSSLPCFSHLILRNTKEVVHQLIYIGKGVFMSKCGDSHVFFHTLDDALSCYGHDLELYYLYE